MSGYSLGVDLGTTFTSAAVWRGGEPESLALGELGPAMPSVVWIGPDGEIATGDEAERRSVADPDRSAREFKRRLGDPVPSVVGGRPIEVESLMAQVLSAVVSTAVRIEGGAPSCLVLTHPANYSEFKIDAMRRVAALAGVPESALVLLTEPEAAAVAFTRRHAIEPGHAVAIYDFGGGTFDAAVVRRSHDRLELVGVPEGLERLGGIDFDQAILAGLDRNLGGAIAGATRGDSSTRAAQLTLRRECRRAKESLGDQDRTPIRIAIGDLDTTAELTRPEFETMIGPRVDETIEALLRSIRSAGLEPEQIDRIILVGGSSRIPLVARRIQERTGRPVSADMDPKGAIAEGASLMGSVTPPPAPPPAAPPPAVAPPAAPPPAAPPPAVVPPAAPPSGGWTAPVRVAPPEEAPIRRRRRSLTIGAIIAVFALGGAGLAVALNAGDDDTASDAPGTTAPANPPGSAPASTTPDDAGTFAPFAFGGAGDPRSGGDARSIGVGTVVAVGAAGNGDVDVVTKQGLVLTVSDGTATFVGALDPADGTAGGVARLPDGSIAVTTRRGLVQVGGGTTTPIASAADNGLGTTPGPITVDRAGSVYFVDQDTRRIIRLGIDRSLNLVAGSGPGPVTGLAESDGAPADSVVLGRITGMAVDRNGSLVYADADLRAVRRISTNGQLSTAVGKGTEPLGSSGVSEQSRVLFGSIDSLALDSSRGLVIADVADQAIVALRTDGSVKRLGAGTAGQVTVLDNGTVVVVPAADPSTLVALQR